MMTGGTSYFRKAPHLLFARRLHMISSSFRSLFNAHSMYHLYVPRSSALHTHMWATCIVYLWAIYGVNVETCSIEEHTCVIIIVIYSNNILNIHIYIYIYICIFLSLSLDGFLQFPHLMPIPMFLSLELSCSSW